MAWKAYATIGMGVLDTLKLFGAEFVQRSSRRQYNGADRRGRNLEKAVSWIVQTKRGLRDVRVKRSITSFR